MFFRAPFKCYWLLFLAVLFGVLTVRVEREALGKVGSGTVHFFFHPECPHCETQKLFNARLRAKYPTLNWVDHDVSRPEEAEGFRQIAAAREISAVELKVPATFFGDRHVIGFEKPETSGAEIEAMIRGMDSPLMLADTRISLPGIGTIDIREYSLGGLAMILGLVDGFNPCAMWVLAYMISLILTLRDRRKIWWLVGTFVFASGVLYFLFLSVWLNAFLFLGYLRPISLLVGLFALGIGIFHLKEFFSGEPAVCRIEDPEGRRKTTARISRIVRAPLNAAGILAILLLAFAVNSVEFVCSAGIPAVFTHVLAMTPLSSWQHYGYLLLYDFFFMLDDLVIFGLAAVAAGSSLGESYARWGKLVGGILLFALGVLLVFFPELLR